MKNTAPADEEYGGGGEISRRIELSVSLGESLADADAVLGRQGARDYGKTTGINNRNIFVGFIEFGYAATRMNSGLVVGGTDEHLL